MNPVVDIIHAAYHTKDLAGMCCNEKFLQKYSQKVHSRLMPLSQEKKLHEFTSQTSLVMDLVKILHYYTTFIKIMFSSVLTRNAPCAGTESIDYIGKGQSDLLDAIVFRKHDCFL